MVITFFISVSLFVFYILQIVNLYGVLPSLSTAYYRLPNNLKFLWTGLCCFCSIILGISLVGVSMEINPTSTFLVILTILGIVLVGMMPAFNDKFQGIFHTIGAVLAAICSTIWVVWNGFYTIPIICYIMGLILGLSKRSAFTWWIEMSAFANMFIITGLLIDRYFN